MSEQSPQATLPATVLQMDVIPQLRTDENMPGELQPADQSRCAEQAGKVLTRVATKAADSEDIHDAFI